MTKVLASVQNLEETRVALHYDIGILDLKNPRDGTLGAMPFSQIQEIARTVDQRIPLSAAIGDLPPVPQVVIARLKEFEPAQLQYLKIGFFDKTYLTKVLPFLIDYAKVLPLAGVLFADRFADFVGPSILLGKAGFRGVMLDTADKTVGGLTTLTTLKSRMEFIKCTTDLGIASGFAGSLSIRDIPALLDLEPTYLGFRTAICVDDKRTKTLSPEKLSEVCHLVSSKPKRQQVAPQSHSSHVRNANGHDKRSKLK